MNICTDRLDVSMLGVRREVKEVEMQEEGQEEEDGKMRVEKEQEEEEEEEEEEGRRRRIHDIVYVASTVSINRKSIKKNL